LRASFYRTAIAATIFCPAPTGSRGGKKNGDIIVRNIEGKVRFTNTKMAIAAALVVASISGASAQSYDPSVGSGNIAPSYHQVTPSQAGRGALGAYARVPRVGSDRVIRRGGGGNPPPNYWYERNREEFRGRW
jgi:hypothetical protein